MVCRLVTACPNRYAISSDIGELLVSKRIVRIPWRGCWFVDLLPLGFVSDAFGELH